MNSPGIEDEMPWDAMLANPTANSCGPHSTRGGWVMVQVRSWGLTPKSSLAPLDQLSFLPPDETRPVQQK